MIKKHVFFHNDIDGIFSAAIYCYYTRLFEGNNYVLHSVNSSSRGGKFGSAVSQVEGDVYVFDFQRYKKAKLWIDHHQDPEVGNAPVLNENICYDISAKSAADLVVRYLSSEHNLAIDDNLSRLINSINMIDGAMYPDVKYIFTDRSPIMIFRAYLETAFPNDHVFCRCVETLVSCNLDIAKALSVLNIDSSCVDKIESVARIAKTHLTIFSNISIIRQKYPYQHPRYAEYYLSPNIMYGIRVTNENSSDYSINISFNRWCGKKNSVNIGAYCFGHKLLKRGGGHYHVGGGVIDKSNLESFLDSFSLLVEEA